MILPLACPQSSTLPTLLTLRNGGDERQYCAPGIDLPIASIMGVNTTYPEYHTSEDNLDLITSNGLEGSLIFKKMLQVLENNRVAKMTVLGEPQREESHMARLASKTLMTLSL